MATADTTNDESGHSSESTTIRGRVRNALAKRIDRIRGREQPNADRRAFLRKAGAAGVAAAAGVSATSGSASAEFGETCSFSRTDDSNLPWSTGGSYGGWGGAGYWGTSSGASKTPVVFVHGNGGDACNFSYIADEFRDRGYTGDELWSISFPEYTNTHDDMRDYLDDFVQNVMNETGKSEVDVVSHSLGVTGVRYWSQTYDRLDWINTFVGLGGANHGVCVCTGCYDHTFGADYDGIMGAGEVCSFIAIQCFSVPGHPLYELNLPDETPGDIDYYTLRGVYDSLYACNIYSPYLSGSEENDYAYRDHVGLLEQEDDVADWVEDGDNGTSWCWWC